MDPVYDRMFCGDETSDFVAGREQFIGEFQKVLPQDQRAIEKYVALIEKCQSALPTVLYGKSDSLAAGLAVVSGCCSDFQGFLRYVGLPGTCYGA